MDTENKQSKLEINELKRFASVADLPELLQTIKAPTTKKPRSKVMRSEKQTSRKKTKYTIRLFDCEYDTLKEFAAKFNVSIMKLLDFFIVDGILKSEPIIIGFIEDCIEREKIRKISGNKEISFDKFSRNERKNIFKAVDDIIDKEEKKGEI